MKKTDEAAEKSNKKALEAALRITDGALAAIQLRLDELDQKRARENLVSWAAWNLVEYAYLSYLKDMWSGVKASLDGAILYGHKASVTLNWLREYRDEMVRKVMAGMVTSSTNPVSNLISKAEEDAHRKFAGAGILDTGSLWAIIHGMENEIGPF